MKIQLKIITKIHLNVDMHKILLILFWLSPLFFGG